jgi:hypothetical protein
MPHADALAEKDMLMFRSILIGLTTLSLIAADSHRAHAQHNDVAAGIIGGIIGGIISNATRGAPPPAYPGYAPAQPQP